MLKLVPPREGRSRNWRIRGTYLGVTVDRSAGTSERPVARQALAAAKAKIERGEFSGRKELTFAAAALSYVQAGGEDRFILPVTEHFGHRILAREIDQAAVDGCAAALYPDAGPATRNRQVYTPVSAVLKHASIETKIRRPKGAQGHQRREWLSPDDADRYLKAASAVRIEFGIFVLVLLATGMRLSDALGLDCRNVDLRAGTAFVARTKNGDARNVYLPPSAVAALASLPAGLGRSGRVFPFRKSGALYRMHRTAKTAAGLQWLTFHHLCHTWATWMRLYGGIESRDLLATGRWRNKKSAERYDHIEVLDPAKRADALPLTWAAKSV
jgi:integrase